MPKNPMLQIDHWNFWDFWKIPWCRVPLVLMLVGVAVALEGLCLDLSVSRTLVAMGTVGACLSVLGVVIAGYLYFEVKETGDSEG